MSTYRHHHSLSAEPETFNRVRKPEVHHQPSSSRKSWTAALYECTGINITNCLVVSIDDNGLFLRNCRCITNASQLPEHQLVAGNINCRWYLPDVAIAPSEHNCQIIGRAPYLDHHHWCYVLRHLYAALSRYSACASSFVLFGSFQWTLCRSPLNLSEPTVAWWRHLPQSESRTDSHTAFSKSSSSAIAANRLSGLIPAVLPQQILHRQRRSPDNPPKVGASSSNGRNRNGCKR